MRKVDADGNVMVFSTPGPFPIAGAVLTHADGADIMIHDIAS